MLCNAMQKNCNHASMCYVRFFFEENKGIKIETMQDQWISWKYVFFKSKTWHLFPLQVVV